MTAYLRALAAGLGFLGIASFGLCAVPVACAHAADDPPANAAATVKTDAKAIGTAVKRDAKIVADAAKEGAQKAAAAAKDVAHHVAVATKQGAHEVAAAAKQGAAKVKTAVKADRPDKTGGTSEGNPGRKPAR